MSELSVALYFSGSRVWTLTEPLEAVGFTYTLEPEDPDAHDAVVLDSPGPEFLKHWLLTESPVYFRLRGNLWKEQREAGNDGVTQLLKDKTLYPRIDGVLAPDERLAGRWMKRVGRPTPAVIRLPCEPSDWPTANHSDTEIRALTLTNCDYEQKIAPLCRYATAVDDVLHRIGGYWSICGDGAYASEVRAATRGLAHVNVRGYQDNREMLREHNLMLHLSDFDIQHPNAVLEGVASGLPVVVNGFEGFADSPLVTQCPSEMELRKRLFQYADPAQRLSVTRKRRETLRAHHTPQRIGDQLRQVIG